ncbi:MAG: dihydroneopterin aldolase [Cyclobacteriaceae bacterium]|nr:dihydroneopterin aldolase [Cyclobacteriaceae bacterium]
MGKITLEGLEFFAFHGYYDEEQKIGNKYGVDITVETFLEKAGIDDKLSETIDYESLYRIIRDEMARPSRLLENIGERIINAVFDNFPTVTFVEISVSKFNPPIGGICRRAVVTLMRDRKE